MATVAPIRGCYVSPLRPIRTRRRCGIAPNPIRAMLSGGWCAEVAPQRFVVYAERTWSPTGMVSIKGRCYRARALTETSAAQQAVCTGKWLAIRN